MKSKILIFLLLTIVNLKHSLGQNLNSSDFGFKIGVNYSFGTHIHRIGLSINSFYYREFAQLNLGLSATNNIRNLGPSGNFWEIVPSAAIHVYWGSEDFKNYYNQDILPETVQSSKAYSAGYGIKYYFDTRETSQATGFFSVNVKNILFATENDVFINYGEDKYRTGSFILMYHNSKIQYFIAAQLWTGGSEYTVHKKDDEYPSRWGYLDRSQSSFSSYSNGILSMGVKYVNFQSQSVSAKVGIDSEWIRHFFQNIIVHDQPFFPESWKKAENPHYPMLQDDGSNYLFRSDEKVKASKLYLQLGLNQVYAY